MVKEIFRFLPSVQKVVEKHFFSSKLVVIPNCGHVVNIEKAEYFNEVVKDFIINWKKI
jgi:pimeloyl-ACP methyl ester carboxylesterase